MMVDENQVPVRRRRASNQSAGAGPSEPLPASGDPWGLAPEPVAVAAPPARAFGAMPMAGDGFAQITERVFDMPDPDAEYAELEGALQLGTQTADSIVSALDRAEDHARRAHRLYVCARVDSERFNLDADVIESAMRTQAVSELQREKDSGVRTKQITDGDTTAKIAAMFPDEHRDLAERRVKSRKMVDHLEAFAQLWRSRCFSLSKMLESRR